MKLTRNLRLLLAASGIAALLPLGCGGATKNAKTEKSRTACGTGTCGGEAPARGKAADKGKEKPKHACGAGGCGGEAPARGKAADKGKEKPKHACGAGGCGGTAPAKDKGKEKPIRSCGFFHRMKPVDFRLRDAFGPIEGADVADWPISYDDLEPYYAKVRVQRHPQNEIVSTHLVEQGERVLRALGAKHVRGRGGGYASTNLVGGTCRFGTDPEHSVLDSNCRAHDVENLYVTDGSFMPTGGSVPFTFTIYANAFRVADEIVRRLPQRTTAATSKNHQ